jgi:hypothetical protein
MGTNTDLRYRRGETNPVFVAPASATVIAIGDLLFLDPTTSLPEPASAFGWQFSLGVTQDLFQDYFLGVAEQESGTGDTDPIRIATEAIFEMDCASATWVLGQLVGPDDNAGGTALVNKQVIAVATRALAIAVCNKPVPAARTKVEIRIRSTIMDPGGPDVVTGSSSSGPV